MRKLRRSAGASWLAFSALVLAAVIVPFVVLEAPMEAWLAGAAASARDTAAALLVVGLLAADIVLPTPSSIVSAFAAATFDWPTAALLIWLGMTLGCAIGYALGASAGRALARGIVGPDELAKARRWTGPIGVAALVLARGVPVLAEASVLVAGSARMPVLKFAVATALANAAIAGVYAATGAAAALLGSKLVLLAAIVGAPTAAYVVWALVRRSARRS